MSAFLSLILLLGLSAQASPQKAAELLPYAGQTLHVLSFQDAHARAVATNLADFEALTGAKVELDAIAANQVAAKIGTDQAAGGSYDLYTVDEPFVPQLASFFLPYSAWPTSRLPALAETKLEAFLPAALAGSSYRETLLGLPVNGNVYMYVHRQDLFSDPQEQKAFRERFGRPLAPPQTMAELRDVAEFFTRPPKLYGFAPFTKSSEGTTVEAMWLLASFGVELFDAKGQAAFDAAKAAEAFAYYKDMMRFAPPGAGNWHHAERMAMYGKGRLAQIMTWPSYVKDLENPEKSLVVGKNAYALPPAAPGGSPAPISGTWTAAIAKSSKSQALAAEFARFWASRDFGRKLALAGMNPARRDLLTDPELLRQNPWFPGVLLNFEKAVVRPRLPDYKVASDLVTRHFTAMISNQEQPAEAAQALRRDLQSLALRSGH
jgi:multiple sugar transport system substrate-binding protein